MDSMYQYISVHTSTNHYMQHFALCSERVSQQGTQYKPSYTVSWKSMIWYRLQFQVTYLYRLVQGDRILKEMPINRHRTCKNSYHCSIYLFYWHSMANSLRILSSCVNLDKGHHKAVQISKLQPEPYHAFP